MCKSQRCMESAKTKPPINKNIVEFMYTEATSLPEVIPSSGKKSRGSNAVAASGSAWDIHKVTISTAMAVILCVPSLGNTGNNSTTKNSIDPSQRPMLSLEELNLDVGIQRNLHC